ncbi:MAG: HD domain-containing protein [Chloroflexi bacterium]|nr:HD domain-containing protein [Chloroflexota bacterium]
MEAALNRVEQGIRALFAFATPIDLQLANQYLSSKELDAFQKMSRADQLHSLNVLRTVMKQRESVPLPLAVAALMHDVGKCRCHLTVWQKTLAVLVKHLIPSLADRLGREENLSIWRAPFVVRSRHAQWSGEILRACCADEVAVWLVEHHQADILAHRDHPQATLLQCLQRADEAC